MSPRSPLADCACQCHPPPDGAASLQKSATFLARMQYSAGGYVTLEGSSPPSSQGIQSRSFMRSCSHLTLNPEGHVFNPTTGDSFLVNEVGLRILKSLQS